MKSRRRAATPHRRRCAPGQAVVIVLLLGASGCDDPLAPAEVAGTYALQSIAGEPLPALLIDYPHYRLRVDEDELRLNADGTGRRITAGVGERLDVQDGPEPVVWDTDLRFRIVGQRIEIEEVCPPNATCLPPPHLIARPVPGGLRVEVTYGDRNPLSYASAPEPEADGS